MSDKVSIVMPVYNTDSAFMNASVKSVIAQTYPNWELIMIDDGSNQECADQCDELKKKDSRICVIHINNSGVANARNRGTAEANGDYIMYVDSDDILARSLLEEGMKIAERYHPDLIFGAVQHIRSHADFHDNGKSAQPDVTIYKLDGIDVVRHAFMTQSEPEYMHIEGVGAVNRGPYARLIRKEIAKHVQFNPSLVIGEDVEWNMRILNACHSVCFAKRNWYGYLIYSASSLRKYYGNRAELLERYHKALYVNNKRYFTSRPGDYARNMAVSFYSMLVFEYMSEQSPLTMKQRSNEVKVLLLRKPWTFLQRPEVQNAIPLKNRVLIRACKKGIGLYLLKGWLIITNHNR